MMIRTKIFQAAAAALMLAGASVASAQTEIGQAVGLLPNTADVVVGLNLKAFENQQSLFSAITRQEVQDAVAAKMQQEGLAAGSPAESPVEAALRIAFSATGAKASTLAIGFDGDVTDLNTPAKEYAVLVGPISAEGAATELQTFGVQPVQDQAGTMTFPSGEKNDIFLAVPRANVLALSTEKAWPSQAVADMAAKKGLTAEGSKFVKAAKGFAGRTPDIFLYVPGTTVNQGASQADPMMMAMVGPLMKTEGFVVALLPGEKPSIEIHAAFPTPKDAEIAQSFVKSMSDMYKGQVQSQLPHMQGNPAAMAQVQQQVDMLNALSTSANGDVATIKMELTNLPPKEQLREQLLGALRQVSEGSIPLAMPGAEMQ